LIAVGGLGERVCGVHPPPALVRQAAGVCVSLGMGRDAAGWVQAGGCSAG